MECAAQKRRVGIDEDHLVEVLTEMNRRSGGEGKPPAFWFIRSIQHPPTPAQIDLPEHALRPTPSASTST